MVFTCALQTVKPENLLRCSEETVEAMRTLNRRRTLDVQTTVELSSQTHPDTSDTAVSRCLIDKRTPFSKQSLTVAKLSYLNLHNELANKSPF